MRNFSMGKFKWTGALALCMGCLGLCIALLARPTMAETVVPAATDKYAAVAGHMNVYEVQNADGSAKTPKQFVYSTDATPGKAYAVSLFLKDSGYYLAAPKDLYYLVNNRGAIVTDTAYTAGADKIFGNADDLLQEANISNYKNTKVVAAGSNIYEALTDANASKSPKEFVYSSLSRPNYGLPLEAAAYNGGYYVKLSGNIYVGAANNNSLDCNDVVAGGTDGKITTGTQLFPKAAAPVVTTTTTTATTTTTTTAAPGFRAVSGLANVYEKLGTNGLSLSPPQFVYSITGQPAQSVVPVYEKSGKYYAEVLKSNVYLSIAADGRFQADNAVWAGEDKIFGTADDKPAVLRGDNRYYYEIKDGTASIWQFLVNSNDSLRSELSAMMPATTALNPSNTSASAATTSTAATTTTVYGTSIVSSTVTTTGATSSSHPFLSNEEASQMPNTGPGPNIGLMVCAAVLLMASLYCGFRLLKRERE